VTICARCGKENQDQHKFCLRCGAEIGTPAPAPAPPLPTPVDHGAAAMAKTMMADPSGGHAMAGAGAQPASPFGGAPFIAPTPFTPAPMPGGVPLPGMPPPAAVVAPGLPAQKPKSSPGGMPSPLSVTPQPGAFGGAAAPPAPAPAAAPSPFGAPAAAPSPFGAPAAAPSPFGAQAAAPSPFGAPAAAPLPFGAPAAAPPAPFSATPFGAPAPAPSPFGAPAAAAPPAPAPSPFGAPAAAAPPGTGQMPAERPCPSCGSPVPGGFKFCGNCGHKIEPLPAPVAAPVAPPPPEPQPVPRPQGRLTLIRPDGSEGGTFALQEGSNTIGRTTAALFENDGYLSPQHAELVISEGGVLVRDQSSLNGVYVKMSGEEEIQPGDIFRIGQELMRFDTISPPTPTDDGTEIMGSPNPGYWGRISVIIGKDIDGSAFPLLGDAVTLGRERGDINFPDDGYVSGLHARLSIRNGRYYLSDLGSSNGSFVKLRGERHLPEGSFVLLGQQLFRINITMV
jgi:pSer/pThr/pTyr-binding forkhead associated (FHA) protein